jgi:uncharacterized protein YecA (UPF0149 family)
MGVASNYKKMRAIYAHRRQRKLQALRAALSAGAVGRNDPCPCGSGKKYKKCCMASPHPAKRTGCAPPRSYP